MLAVCKDGDGAARHVELLTSEIHSSILSCIVVGEESQAQFFLRQLEVVCLQVQETNQAQKKVDYKILSHKTSQVFLHRNDGSSCSQPHTPEPIARMIVSPQGKLSGMT
jgi:hypothetical protein